jgi:hypothetical protein
VDDYTSKYKPGVSKRLCGPGAGVLSSSGQVSSIASISHSGRYTQRALSRFVADRGGRSRRPVRVEIAPTQMHGLAEP